MPGKSPENSPEKPLPIGTRIETDLPVRLDRLPWSRFHLRVVFALGITWILDGLEVTIVGAVASVLGEPQTLHLSETQVGIAASSYLAGAMVGALFFGRMTDRFGRKKLFLITLAVYLCATLLTALSVDIVTFAIFRALTGMGIGGECSAMNSAIDELIPAEVRGRIDLTINGSYWLGTALGAGSSLVLLNENLLPHAIGWRLAFGLGAILGAGVLFVRRHLPESPRWLLLHGHRDQAEAIVKAIEADVEKELGHPLPPPSHLAQIDVKGSVSLRHAARVILVHHARRSLLALSLMVSQAFTYNAIFFTYALVLTRFYGVPPGRVGLYLLPFAAGNFLGPIILGHFFDTIGRRVMIALSYGIAGVLLAITATLFLRGALTATTQTALWTCVFFFASAAASSAYLSVSELFPVELRGLAIALFYVAGLAVGGLFAPTLLAALIETGERARVFDGYLLGAGLMIAAAVVAAWLALPAERKSLEAIAGMK